MGRPGGEGMPRLPSENPVSILTGGDFVGMVTILMDRSLVSVVLQPVFEGL